MSHKRPNKKYWNDFHINNQIYKIWLLVYSHVHCYTQKKQHMVCSYSLLFILSEALLIYFCFWKWWLWTKQINRIIGVDFTETVICIVKVIVTIILLLYYYLNMGVIGYVYLSFT